MSIALDELIWPSHGLVGKYLCTVCTGIIYRFLHSPEKLVLGTHLITTSASWKTAYVG